MSRVTSVTGNFFPEAPLRIGLLHQYQLGTSGSGIYLRRLAQHLVRRGHAVSLMSHDPTPVVGGGAGRRDPTYRAHSLRGAGTPVAYPRAEEPDSALFRDLSDPELASYLSYHVDKVTRIVEHERLDILHANSEIPMSYVAAMVSRRTGVPYVTVAHGSSLEYLYRVDSRYRELCQVGLGEAATIVVLNRDVHDRMIAVAPQIADKLRVVPPGVDCSIFRPLDVAGHRPLLAYVGRIATEKGAFIAVGCLPQIAARVPDVKLVVIGDGSQRAGLERLGAALSEGDLLEAETVLRGVAQPTDEPWVTALVGSWATCRGRRFAALDLTFTGHLNPADVAAQMAAADAVVVPSLVREAFPLVVLEALASGTPPLAVDTGGLGAVLGEITPKLGDLGPLLALAGAPKMLVRDLPIRVAALLDWLALPGHSLTAQRRCRSLAVESYSWSRVGARVESLYREAVGTHRGAAHGMRAAGI